MAQRNFRPGDRVVFFRTRHKSHPGRRARGVRPSAHGDDYSYYVEKFWVVADVLDDGRLLLQTPRGKQHEVDVDDPNLQHASWLDRLLHRQRFIQSDARAAAD
jgi:hypothetical protein